MQMSTVCGQNISGNENIHSLSVFEWRASQQWLLINGDKILTACQTLRAGVRRGHRRKQGTGSFIVVIVVATVIV